MSYKFIKTHDPENKHDITDVIIETTHNELSIPDLLEVFEEFLKASGFVFKGHIDIVESDDE